MEIWNSRNLLAPPTYTYQEKVDEIDIVHLKTVLQDGIKFYNEQSLLDMDVALLSRVIYRMKTKFHNSKDFHTFEKVKRTITIFKEIDISKKLEYLLSILPNYDYQQIFVSVPTKNMIDYIIVQLQGIGKILCKVLEACKLTVIIYEHRMFLGHFWQLALISIALVSRIHILCLNMIKYTCILYARLLPFSHKLKNVTKNWLPQEYVFPKDLKIWLDVEWSKLEEPIEIPDDEFHMSFIDLAVDSDDDVECIEISDVMELLEDFKKIRKSRNPNDNLGKSIVSPPSVYDINEKDSEEENMEEQIPNSPTRENVDTEDMIIETETKEEIAQFKKDKMAEIDIGEEILSDDEIIAAKNEPNEVVISSSEGEDSVQFVGDSTAEFIPLGVSTPAVRPKKNKKKRKKSGGKEKKNPTNSSVITITDSPSVNSIYGNRKSAKNKAMKRKMTNNNVASPKKKKKQGNTT